MRRFKGNRRKGNELETIDVTPTPMGAAIKNSISYSDIMGVKIDV